MKEFRFVLIFIFAVIQSTHISAQSTDKINTIPSRTDSVKIQFDNNKIEKYNTLTNYSDTIGSNSFIWNDRRNIQEILNQRTGFYSFFLGTAGKSLISYNGLTNVGVFRNGIESNDLFYGGFDVENFSINEIDKIEEVSAAMSFMYGLNTYNKIINVIDKDLFQPNLFTQFRYSQDRDGALFADVFMNFPVSRKFNFVLGINSYGSEGHYSNTDFSIWRSRFHFNYFPSEKFNLKLFYSANKTQRGLNEGLQLNSSKDTLIDPNIADIVNPDAYEKIFNSYGDIKFTGKFFADTLSLTNFNIFTYNSLREYRDEENRQTTNKLFAAKNFHSIQYGFNLNQSVFLIPFNYSQIKLLAGIKGYYNLYNYDRTSLNKIDSLIGTRYYSFNAVDLYSRLDLVYDNIILSGSIKSQRFNNSYHFMYGTEFVYNLFFNNDFNLTLKGGLNNTTIGFNYESLLYEEYFNRLNNNYDASRQQYYEAGFKINYKDLVFSYLIFHSNFFKNLSALNSNLSFGYDSKHFSLLMNMNLVDKENNSTQTVPPIYISSDIAYKDVLFKNKLILKTGFNVRFISEKPANSYDQFANKIKYINNYSPFEYFVLDYYLGARIGKANVSITLANLFNSLVYDTVLYPYDNRGGLLRSISRFTITWDFWN